jgi:hypothetical protein
MEKGLWTPRLFFTSRLLKKTGLGWRRVTRSFAKTAFDVTRDRLLGRRGCNV